MNNDYKNDLKIDQYNLDEEVIKQPVLFDLHTSELTILYAQRDTLKLDIERIYARLDVALRNLAVEEGKKLTETALESQIINNKEYQLTQDKFNIIVAKIKETEAIKEAFSQKRDSLKLLVDLFTSGYWQTVSPKVLKQKRVESIKEKIAELKKITKED